MNSRSKGFFISVIMLLILAACGGTSTTTKVESPPEETRTEQPAATEPQAKPSGLVCEDPAPEEIGLGTTIESASEDPQWTTCFWVDVPEGLSSVTFSLSGMTGDLSLFVGYGFVWTVQYHFAEFWQSIHSGPVDEVIVMENPKPGPYFIKVGPGGPKDPSQFTLDVQTEPEMTGDVTGAPLASLDRCERPAQELTLDEPVQGELADRDDGPNMRDYYCIQLPDGMNSVNINLSGLTGFLELFVLHDQPAQWTDRSRQGDSRSVTIEDPSPGLYYIDVAVAVDGSSSPYTLTVIGQ